MSDLNALAQRCYNQAADKGFHENDADNNPAERLALIASEVFEAFEDVRAGRPLDKNYYTYDGDEYVWDEENAEWWTNEGYVLTEVNAPKPEGVPSELADVLIRVLDLSVEWGIDIEAAVEEKLAYNATRGFKHGKQF